MCIRDSCRRFLEAMAKHGSSKRRSKAPSRTPPAHIQQLVEVLGVVGGLRLACLLDKVFLSTENWGQVIQSAGADDVFTLLEIMGSTVVVNKHLFWDRVEGELENPSKLMVNVSGGCEAPHLVETEEEIILSTLRQWCGLLRERGSLDWGEVPPGLCPCLAGLVLGYPVLYHCHAPAPEDGNTTDHCGNCLGGRPLMQYTVTAKLAHEYQEELEQAGSLEQEWWELYSYTCPIEFHGEPIHECEAERITQLGEQSVLWETAHLQATEICHPSVTL
eukprot:TRINITY_DN49149_c0_g1_i2.p1 TRINITY_DN49149_c0_g1~~TRINITY_DN49149_c0_g1_i2.p1  ORF type:complete len:275 (+),score=60.46 TRINITY_DN49149_c0_g1_i2:201-1025(+)